MFGFWVKGRGERLDGSYLSQLCRPRQGPAMLAHIEHLFLSFQSLRLKHTRHAALSLRASSQDPLQPFQLAQRPFEPFLTTPSCPPQLIVMLHARFCNLHPRQRHGVFWLSMLRFAKLCELAGSWGHVHHRSTPRRAVLTLAVHS